MLFVSCGARVRVPWRPGVAGLGGGEAAVSQPSVLLGFARLAGSTVVGWEQLLPAGGAGVGRLPGVSVHSGRGTWGGSCPAPPSSQHPLSQPPPPIPDKGHTWGASELPPPALPSC